jgi:hypothetical protein
MPWEAIFNTANLWAILCWAFLIFAPMRERLVTPLFVAGVGLLAASYAIFIVGLLTGLIDGGGNGAVPDLSTLAGVQTLFDARGGATIGWIHYLAFDLFVGIWAARNADRRGIGRVAQAFIFMAGPFGLLLYLIMCQFIGSRPENSLVPS